MPYKETTATHVPVHLVQGNVGYVQISATAWFNTSFVFANATGAAFVTSLLLLFSILTILFYLTIITCKHFLVFTLLVYY